jgi:di/tricarboxylate transporter
MSDAAVVFIIVGAVVVLFIWNRLPVEGVALGTALALAGTGVLSLDEAFSGFGDPTVIFIASLFIVSEGLDVTGTTAWLGQRLIRSAGGDRTRLLVLMMVLVAALTSLISVNGAVAALMPVVVIIAVRMGEVPSKLLMPLAFAAHAGSLLLLTGTPVNIIVSDLAEESGEGRFGFLEFGIVGVPLLVGTIAIVVLFGDRLLPVRRAATVPRDLGDHGLTLVQQYGADVWVSRHRVLEGSPLIGVDPADVELAVYPGVHLLGVDPHEGHVIEDTAIAVGDVVVVHGGAEALGRLVDDLGLAPSEERPLPNQSRPLISREFGAVEVMVPPRSAMIGDTVFPGMVTESGHLVILAIQRQGHDLGPGPVRLAAGDTLLVQGTWDAIVDNIDDPEILVVDSPDLVRRQAVAPGAKTGTAVAILAGMVVALATGVVAPATAALVAAGAMVLSGVLRLDQAYRAVSWTTVILVAGMLPLSQALVSTGGAETLAGGLLDLVGDRDPRVLLAGLFVLTAVMGQLISNTATALVVAPIALSAAADAGVSSRPLLMAVAIAAAGAFFTPVATPVNTMIMGPAGYRFGDYWKLGLPLMLWFLLVAVVVVPAVWRF